MNPRDEEPEYRSPVALTPRNTNVPVADERDFSTLKKLQTLVNEADAKARDNNTLDLSNPTVSIEAQLYGLQWALDNIITPFKTTVDNAVNNVETQNRGEES